MNQKISTRRIAMAGLLAALTAVGSALRITIPVTIGGTSAFHLGNIFCALSGILLGPGLGGVAAGLGSAIYDMTNPAYISEAWLTFLLKGAYALAAGLAYRNLKLGEYLRDKKAGIDPDVPVNYFPNDDDSAEPVCTWRSSANLLYCNWLNYFVYQDTPYDLKQIGLARKD